MPTRIGVGEAQVCPPSSPEDPSTRIMHPLRLLPIIPSRRQLDAMYERSPPNQPAPPSRLRLTCTRPESRRSRQHLSGTLRPPSCVRGLPRRIAAWPLRATWRDPHHGCSFENSADSPCRARYKNEPPCCRE